ncbi:MAG: NAD-dependent epimerase/dehydratase family protein [Clostridiales bacterium]|nr:NAD-dependent epimerase/dehydratase family protein [Clostridiales bacterium]
MKELYLVTGAKGHLGNTIIRRLKSEGKWVRGLALPGDSSKALNQLDVEVFEGDICDPASIEPAFETKEPCERIVIHTAGIVSIASKFQQKVFDVNVTGTANIIALCRKYSTKRLIYTSSVHAIPAVKGTVLTEITQFDPDKVEGLYAKTKAQAAQLVLDAAKAGLDAIVVHPSGIIGPYDYGHGHLTQLIMDYLDHRLVACVNGGYDFVDVRDVADGILSAAEHGSAGACYILSGHYCSIPALLNMLSELSGRKPVKTILPTWLAKATAPLAEWYYKLRHQPPLYTRYSLFTLGSNADFSYEKAKEELGYQPRPLAQTLKDTVGWLEQNKRVKPHVVSKNSVG